MCRNVSRYNCFLKNLIEISKVKVLITIYPLILWPTEKDPNTPSRKTVVLTDTANPRFHYKVKIGYNSVTISILVVYRTQYLNKLYKTIWIYLNLSGVLDIFVLPCNIHLLLDSGFYQHFGVAFFTIDHIKVRLPKKVDR